MWWQGDICSKTLTHIVHLYGRFPRNTSNSNSAVNTVSQLRLLQLGISARFPAYEDEQTCRCRQVYDSA